MPDFEEKSIAESSSSVSADPASGISASTGPSRGAERTRSPERELMQSGVSATGSTEAPLTRHETFILLASVLVVALCGIAYELTIATVSSYLLGNSVYQFSITVGLFMFAMGIGSYLTRYFSRNLVETFVWVEVIVALLGGLTCTLLFTVFPHYAAYKPVMFGLILVIGACVGIEIPLLTRLLSQNASLRQSIASVLSLDYLGALIGSVAFPILLLPQFGLFRASFAVALLNIAVAFVTIITFRSRLKRSRSIQFVAAGVLTVLLVGLGYSLRIQEFAEGRLFAETIIFRKQTAYQRIVVSRDERSAKIRLFLDGHIQFAEQDEYRYHEALVHPLLAQPGPRRKILVLGGGDGMVCRELLKYPDVESIDLVDLDPGVTELCRTMGKIRALNGDSLDHPKVTVHHEDAFTFVRRYRDTYDRCIIDLPDPRDEQLNKLYSVEFYRLLERALTAGGSFCTQSTSPYFARPAYWCIVETVEAAGFSVIPYQVTVPSFSIWGFTLARKGEPLARLSIDRELGLRFLNDRTLAAAQTFPPDMAKLDELPVNSIYLPRLYELYLKSLKN